MFPVHCSACGSASDPRDQFCATCGAFVRDDTTRYLCAAVHLEPDLCRAVLDEFTVEPVRAHPPSPGLNVTAVLRDALAARARRRVRDAVLVVLFLLLLPLAPSMFFGWLMVSAAVLVVRRLPVGRSPAVVVAAVVAGLVVAYAVTSFVAAFLYELAGLAVSFGLSGGDLLYSLVRGGIAWIALPVLLVMIGVFALDAFVAWLIRTRFRRTRFRPDPRTLPTGDVERTLRTFGHQGRREQIHRIEANAATGPKAGQVPLVVHRGFHPFVGSGEIRAHEALAISLEARDKDGTPGTVDVLAAHERVTAALAALRRSSSLGPGGRLAAMTLDDVVLVPARDLTDHADTDLAVSILPRLRPPWIDHVPSAAITRDDADRLARAPQEWARYYRRLRIEAWNRELVHTTYIHIGTDERNLYLERVH